jgi:S-sulfosulfanyl-L-cysteine sulfohydrolase
MMDRREFAQVMGAAAVVGGSSNWLSGCATTSSSTPSDGSIYDIPAYGNVSLLHMTDCHAQLWPIQFREPSINLGVASMFGKAPHLVGDQLLRSAGIAPNSRQAHAFTYLDFEQSSRRFGKVGGFAHLATLVKRLKASRKNALLLDGGDTWQGSATALWTDGQDMVDACKLLGVDIMTGHWEFTLGQKRVKEIIDNDFANQIEFLAQNIKTADFEDPVFKPYTIRSINGISVAIIGQAFPYTPIANPRYQMADWTFGIREPDMQKTVDEVRSKGVQAVVLLSHNGMDVDLKMASRVRGIDAILGGHTHDGVPVPVMVDNAGGKTMVTNAGSNGKFLGVLDLDVKGTKVVGFKYNLLPIFSDLLPADPQMAALLKRVRAPHAKKLDEVLTVTDGLLYRRGNFNGSWDQLILNGLMATQNTPIAFSPGFRWGTSLLPGQNISRELFMDQVATTYSFTTVTEMTGDTIKTILEDVADNLFNPDPYYQQGGDMVRVGGLTYAMNPLAKMGGRIQDMRLGDQLIEANKRYRVAGWAPVSEEARQGNKPIWEHLEPWLQSQKTVKVSAINTPRLIGVANNPGVAQNP